MTQDTLAKQLNESRRDALLTYYKGYVEPWIGRDEITDEDVYQYLLMDPDVSEEVETSRAAQAISSVQQYLYRIALNREPGFNPMSREDLDEWRDIESQYAIWSAGQQVSDYPENYISPSTRQNKSKFFRELENTLNQNQLDPDRVQDTVLTYLNEFESVSNLQVINGYCDQDDFGKGKYFFVGRTADQPYRYYWRSMDLSKNGGTSEAPIVTPNCWNDWQQVDLPLGSDNVLSWTIRPVYFNNRLYVTWAERSPTPTKTDGKTHAYTLHYGYLRYDDTWTAPAIGDLQHDTSVTSTILSNNELLIDENASDFTVRQIDTVAVVDTSLAASGSKRAEGNLFVGLFYHPKINDNTKRAFIYCDTSMVSLSRASDQIGGNFLLYKPSASKDGITSQPIQFYMPLAKTTEKYEIVSGSLQSEGTEGNKQWSSSFTPPNVEILGDGITLQINSRVGKNPDTDDGAWQKEVYTFNLTDHGNIFNFYFSDKNGIKADTISFRLNGNNLTPIDSFFHFILEDEYYINGYVYLDVFTNPPGHSSIHFPFPPQYFFGGIGSEHLIPLKPIPKLYFDGSYYMLGGLSKDNDGGVGPGTDNELVKPLMGPPLQFRPSLGLYSQTEDARFEFWQGSSSVPPRDGDPLALSHKIRRIEDLPDSDRIFHYRIRMRMEETSSSNYGVGKWVFQVRIVSGYVEPVAGPQICTRYDSKMGTVQFLSFAGITAAHNTAGFTLPDTRLNTTFVPLLIQQANISLEHLLSYSTQATKIEPALKVDGGALQPMDYTGANGLYFWELFFHVPFMVASRFASEGQNGLSQNWFHFIFDPGAQGKPTDVNNLTPPDYWNCYVLMPLPPTEASTSTSSFLMEALLDPDAHAYANPTIYRKAVYLAYLRTVIALGDSQYRMVTPDGLTAARVYYDIAIELLGPSPEVMVSEQWRPTALGTLSADKSSGLRAFEEEGGLNLLDMPSQRSTFLTMLDKPHFRPPLNSELLSYWKTLDSRLYNLRNNLSIDGKPLHLSLYATPADPMTLLTQRAAAGSQGATGLPAAQIVLPYRFQFMLPVASTAVAMLTQYGDLLLSFLERGESAQQVELGQQQMVDVSGFAISLQQQELKALEADAEALNAQKAIADQRFEFYWDNYNENISSAEQQSMDMQTISGQMSIAQTAFNLVAGGVDLAPNIFGLADGGMHYGALPRAVGDGIGLARQVLEIQSTRLAQTENYRRRRDEWQEQYIQAELESEMIGKQLDALAIRQQAVRTSIEQATMQQKQQQAMLQFLTSRFTQASLYQWLGGQLSALYYQAYDSVLSLCLNVQSCWQYELGDFATTFMRTNAWNNSYRGLLAGQALALDLQRMERAYYTRNDRPLNISRTVSLKALLKGQSKDFENVKKTGSFDFQLPEALFDNDYPGHYARRLQQVSITLPTLLGPYQNVRAILSQSSSSTLFKPNADGMRALLNSTTPPADSGVVTNLRPSQQVALSGGLDDNGVFALTMQDGRYLPFEGTGAVSSWTLQFPRSVNQKDGSETLDADPEQAAMLAALDDVLIHVQYTALDGGAQFASAVRQELAKKQKATATGTSDHTTARKSRVKQSPLREGKGTSRKA